jgi:hypothetical protein
MLKLSLTQRKALNSLAAAVDGAVRLELPPRILLPLPSHRAWRLTAFVQRPSFDGGIAAAETYRNRSVYAMGM